MSFSSDPLRPLSHASDIAQDTALEALNLFVDGELDLSAQGPLFAHLSECIPCRRELEHIMRFRRMSRAEYLIVPPIFDEAFFKRLDAVRVNAARIDRASDRRPLWQRKASLSVRAVALSAAMVFLAGLLIPANTPAPDARGSVVGTDETIEFAEVHPAPGAIATLYVFYPGLTVEAAQDDD
jgi:anti-sigma factor RsiW